MGIRDRIKAFIDRHTKASMILDLMTKKEYVTCSDIINYQCENAPIVFTTSPHKIIETIRKQFGSDFVKDEDVRFTRTCYNNGKPYTMSDSYKRYFLNYNEEM